MALPTYINYYNSPNEAIAQSSGLNTALAMKNDPNAKVAWNNITGAMQDYTNSINAGLENKNIWNTYNDHLAAYNHNRYGYNAGLRNNSFVDNAQRTQFAIDSDKAVTLGYGNSVGDLKYSPGAADYLNATIKNLEEANKPGFFGNVWNKILEQPGAFTQSALNIWNGYNAYRANKDYMNLARESFDLQKQQYLDREERTKKEFEALQSRRAGSSL